MSSSARARVVDRGLDLPAVADDRRVAEQALDVARAELGDRGGVEARERAAERLALAQDRHPREPGLEALETELLEQPAVVDDGQAPLAVVVGAVVRVGAPAPPAAGDAVLVPDEAFGERHQRTTISIGSPASGTPPSAVTSQVSCM